jgi:ribosomal protein S18 acetylase RimI-like enzyme
MNDRKIQEHTLVVEPITIHRSQVKAAAAVMARAFYNDPPLVYSITDASQRRAKSHYIFEMYIRYSIFCGKVYATSPNFEGVAVWLPSDKVEMSFRQELTSGWLSMLLNLGPGTTIRQRTISSVMGIVHKRCISAPHRYLFFLGVEPELQGKGYAGRLLRPVLNRADRDGLACYLDNTNEKNLTLYQHFGFNVIEEYKIPETSISIWAMLRGPG